MVYLEPERSLPSLTVQTPIHEHKAFHDLPSLFSHLTSLQPSWPSLFLHHGCFKVTETVSPVWSHFPSDLCRAGLLSLFKSYFKFTSSDQPSLAILFPPTQLFYMFLIYFLHGSYQYLIIHLFTSLFTVSLLCLTVSSQGARSLSVLFNTTLPHVAQQPAQSMCSGNTRMNKQRKR